MIGWGKSLVGTVLNFRTVVKEKIRPDLIFMKEADLIKKFARIAD
jgi:hypothetical protein